jgi:hypothetical protein
MDMIIQENQKKASSFLPAAANRANGVTVHTFTATGKNP